MTSQELLQLSTRLVKDLKAWSEEATRLDTLSAEELAMLRRAAEIVDRGTVAAVVTGPPADPAGQS